MSQTENFPQTIVVPETAEGLRIDRFICGLFPDYSRNLVQKWIVDQNIFYKEKAVKKNLKVEAGMELRIDAPPQLPPTELIAENIPLNIVYEDDDLVVINKPKNMVVHPGNGVFKGTLAAGLLYHYQNLSSVSGADRPGIVHRLDRDTSGLMVCARNDVSHRKLSAQLEVRDVHRTYWALVWGQITEPEGTIEALVGRSKVDRTKMCVRPGGRTAKTHYKVLEYFEWATLVELKLDTGRTHQIRVHMKHIGFPIIGDALYNGREKALERMGPMERPDAKRLMLLTSSQALQAIKLSFNHPTTNKFMEFEIEPEKELANCIQYLRNIQKKYK